jgi:hypothetical protein
MRSPMAFWRPLTIADSWTSRLVYTAFHLHARQQPCYLGTSSAPLTSLTLRPPGPPPEAGHLRWEDVLMEAREEATTQVL